MLIETSELPEYVLQKHTSLNQYILQPKSNKSLFDEVVVSFYRECSGKIAEKSSAEECTFDLYSISFWMAIPQKLTHPGLALSILFFWLSRLLYEK